MAKRPEKAGQLAAPPTPTPEQVKRIRKAQQRNAERGPRLAHTAYPNAAGEMNIGADHSDQDGWIAHLADACGTSSQSFAAYLLGTLEPAMRDRGACEIKPSRANAVMAALDGIAPENEAEAMLAAQMIGTHALATEMLSKARHTDTMEALALYGSLAAKLLRTYTMQTEALAKLRRKGEQIVKHVHVNDGGQAIVGTVNNYGGEQSRGGARNENLGQPHAAVLEHAPGLPMWGSDAAGATVQVASGSGEEAVQNARRRGRKRGAKGSG